MKFNIVTILKCTISVTLSTFTVLDTRLHTLFPGCLLSSQAESLYPWNGTSLCHPCISLSPGNLSSAFVSMHVPVLGTPCKWNHTLFVLWCLTYFTQHNVSWVRIPFYVYTTLKKAICSPVDAYLGCFHLLAVVSSAAVNIGVQESFWVPAFSASVYLSGFGIARLYANYVFDFLS